MSRARMKRSRSPALAAVLVAVVCAVGCDKDKTEPGPTAAPASASVAPTPGGSTPAAAAAPGSISAAAVEVWLGDTDTATAVKPAGPIEIARRHTAGQRYSVVLEDTQGTLTTALTGLATITSPKPEALGITLLVDSIRKGATPVAAKPSFDIKGDTTRSPVAIEARLGSEGASPVDSTMVEHMAGTLCAPPKGKHQVGEKWTANDASWQLTAYEKIAGEEFATYEVSSVKRAPGNEPTWKHRHRVSVVDGFTGSCTAEEIVDAGPLGSKPRKSTLVVKRSASPPSK